MITLRFHYSTLLIICICAAALIVRLYAIGSESLWTDEIGHYDVSMRETLSEVLDGVRSHRGATPLDYLLLRGYLTITDFSSAAGIRSLYALYGTLSVLALYLAGKEAHNRVTGLAAAAGLAIFELHIYYSQEIRFYALSILLAIVCFWLFLRAIRQPSWSAWSLWAISAVAGLYTAYFFALPLVVQGIYLLFTLFTSGGKWRSHLLPFATLSLVIVALFAPWLYWDSQYDQFQSGTARVSILDAFTSVAGYNFPSVNLLYGLLVLVALAAVFDHRAWLWFGTVAIIFFGAIAIDNFSGYFFHPRQVLLAYPFLILGAIAAPIAIATKIQQPQIGIGATAILCLYLIWSSVPGVQGMYNSNTMPTWDAVTQELASQMNDGDTVLVLSRSDQREARFHFRRMNPAVQVITYEDATSLPLDTMSWAVATRRRDDGIPQSTFSVLTQYSLQKQTIGNIDVYSIDTSARPPTTIDPASLPATVRLDGYDIVVLDGWTARRDNQNSTEVTSTESGSNLWFGSTPEIRARAGFSWVGELNLSEHHTGIMHGSLSDGCLVYVETLTVEEGRQRVQPEWTEHSATFPVLGNHLTRIDLLIDAVDATECTLQLADITFTLDSTFQIK